MQSITIISILLLSLFLVGFLYLRVIVFKKEIKEREEKIRHQVYELAILKEISDRVGYSLNLKKIVDVITGSLSQFIEFSTASYMLVEPDSVVFKIELDKSVSKDFIGDVKKRMIDSLSVLLEKDLSKIRTKDVVTGLMTSENKNDKVRSFFNIPLVVDGNVLGILTVAHTKDGLYGEKEMTLLYKIVAQATHAVEQLEDVIKTEQGKLGAMVESMTDGVVMIDSDYRIIVANPTVKDIIGFNNNDEDISIFDFIDRFSSKFEIRRKIEESVKMGKIFAIDDVLIKGKMFRVFISPVTRSILSGGDKILGGLIILHDVTKIKETEKMREDFTSMMVHELRSPLDGIKKMGEFMRTNSSVREDEKTYDEYMRMIYESSSEMLELVSDLLDVTKIESGKFSVNKTPSSIKKIINERIKFFETSARDSKVELVSFFGSSIPEKLEVDSIKISQVLNNLISNALKFTNPGGRVVVQSIVHKKNNSLKTEAENAGVDWFIKEDIKDLPDSVVVGVTDNGPGIPKNDIEKLFNKFVQFEAAARSKKRGTGLGLVVVRGIIKAHGGILGVASEEEVGSTFYFTIRL